MSTTRKIQVFSTKGKRKATIETDATKWRELRNLIENEGYDVAKLHATENINRTDLAHDDAALPDGDFTIFLRPKKTKSGFEVAKGLSFKELRAIAKEYKKKDGDKFIDHLNDNSAGVNWTRLNGNDLRTQMESYGDKPKAKKSKKKAVVEEVKEVAKKAVIELNNAGRFAIISGLLTSVQNNTEDEMLDVRCDDIAEEVEELVDMVIEEDGETSDDDIQAMIDAAASSGPDLSDELAEINKKLQEANETIDELEEQLAKKKEERDSLEKESDSMMKGFNY